MIHTPTFVLRLEYLFNPHIHASRGVDSFGNTTSERWSYGPTNNDIQRLLEDAFTGVDARIESLYAPRLGCHWILAHKHEVIKVDRTILYGPHHVIFDGSKRLEMTRLMLKMLKKSRENK